MIFKNPLNEAAGEVIRKHSSSSERVLKGKSNGQAAYVNGEWTGGSGSMGNYTVYVNPYLVLKSGSYTKHFYIEGQRIVSKLGDGMGDATKGNKAGKGEVNYGAKQEESREGVVRNLKWLGQDGSLLTAGNSGKTPPGQIINDGTGGSSGGGNKDGEKFQYFYHPDHLGSTSYITDASGEVYQHLEYFAFGETFVEEHSNTSRTPCKFNGKELDEETGLYYYGARYYDPQISIFASFDPLAELYPNVSPYVYVFNNPLNYIDPTGMSGEGVTDPPTEEELEATKEGGWVKSNDGHTQKLAAVTVKASRIEDNNSGGGNGVGKAGNDVQNGGADPISDEGINPFQIAWAVNGIFQMGTDIAVHGPKNKYTGPGDWAKQIKLGKNLTKKFGVVGIGITMTDAAVQGQWQNHHTADVAIGVATTFLIASNPFTATVVGGYFLIDLGVQLYSGRSITEHLFDPTPITNGGN